MHFPTSASTLPTSPCSRATGDTLVAGERLGLALDFWSLWGDQPQIGSITLEGGTPSLRSTMKEGGQMPFKTPEATDGDSPQAWTLGTVLIRNCAVRVKSPDKRVAALHVDRLECVLGSSSTPMTWRGSASDIQFQGLSLPSLKPFDLSVEGSWSKEQSGAWSTQWPIRVGGH